MIEGKQNFQLVSELSERLEQLIQKGLEYIIHVNSDEFSKKISPEKWSKKEILGHLIDSGIHNLQRFTEIQFEPKPYKIRKYMQDDWVKANDYQHADIQELVGFWKGVNSRIRNLILLQTDLTMSYAVDLGNDKLVNLDFLIRDYIDHLEHHLRQITGN